MGIFSKKESPNETLTKRVSEITIELNEIKAKLRSLDLENEDLRNKVLRKLQEKRKKIEEEQQTEIKQEPKIGEPYKW